MSRFSEEATRDPIFLLQVGRRQWTEIPDGIGIDSSVWTVEDEDLLPDWLLPFVAQWEGEEEKYIDTSSDEFLKAAETTTNDWGWPICYVEWRTERVFFSREEAEQWGGSHHYRWDKWRVFCVPCEGKLADLLNEQESQI